MLTRVRRQLETAYERHLRRTISGAPAHVAVIQDGNRRYATKQGAKASEGHREGAKTTERVLDWCEDIGVEELTLYTFSTENFDRPKDQREALFDLLENKLYEFADAERIHDSGVCIRAIGDVVELPARVREAIDYAEGQTHDYDNFVLNIALAYGGRNELLGAARDVAREVESGDLAPDGISVETIESRLYDRPIRDVDLIIRTGGDERTSNFLPWHANGNEAAVFFCTPYWPEFSKIDFLRAVRTYESREQSFHQAKVQRALALVRAIGGVELDEARSIIRKFRGYVPDGVAMEELDGEERTPE
ncbi:polyprenyl diphosphate synthase [Haladaptatus pallidirubidus]|uniref:Tritrans,polycis-undecaprenyl-diphosphate synthase (geranylgeranyl-diphosphate specific) n=1 Tax=Haladaptatus pallidirubidus TaxID=1008152 RepID=A0AAV3UEU6_9EURY|nr:polyprenyl diphosphate synthase [Haladaptatus pallidirubidus]